MLKQKTNAELITKIAVFDTACGSENLGDHIIMDAVKRELYSLFPSARFTHFPTHQELTSKALKQSCWNQLGIVGGTNILRNRWYHRARKNQWKVAPQRFSVLPKTVMFGVGCNNYQQDPSDFTRRCYQRLLNNGALHSVRDDYSLQYLQDIGIQNVVNTACPTFWSLTTEHCAGLPVSKAEEVVFTLTDYRRDPELDRIMVQQLLGMYSKVHFWPQGPSDESYLQQLVTPEQLQILSVLQPRLDAYDDLLTSPTTSVEFVGTRLHAGCRAMQKGRRALIIGVDNRAQEKQKNFNIPVLQRQQIQQLQAKLNSDLQIKIRLPEEAIQRWKQQFEIV